MSSSPAINTGAPLSEVSKDYADTVRPQGGSYDIGAFEFTLPVSQTPSVSLAASPAAVTPGSSSTLSWSSTNASSCMASGAWTGTKAVSGTQSTGSINSSQTYVLTCSAPGGSPTAQAAVTVQPVPYAASVTTNLALNRPTVASSVENSPNVAQLAADGNPNTRWASALYQDPQWIYVDLGQAHAINRVVIKWETAYASAYQIQVSNNAVNWTTVRSVTNGSGGRSDLTGLSGYGRYVRMLGTTRGSPWGYSLWEFEVYGSPINPPTGGFTLTVNGSNGTVTRNPNQTTYPAGAQVTLTAAPASGYQFSGWSGDITAATNPVSVTMNCNKTVSANYSIVASSPYTITASAGANGTISPSGIVNVTNGTQRFVVNPNTGYRVLQLIVNGSPAALASDGSYTFNNVTANQTISAQFTAVSQPTGNIYYISPSGNNSTGTGSIERPFATVSPTLNVLNDGDTIVFRAGTYDNPGGIMIRRNNITLKAHDGSNGVPESVTLVTPADGREINNITFWEGRNGKIINLRLQGGYYAVKYEPMMGPGLVQGCKIFNTYGDHIKIAADKYGSHRQVNDVQILNNEIYNTPGFVGGPNAQGVDNVRGDRMIAKGNYVHDIPDIALYAKGGARNCIFENNLIMNTRQGIILGQDTDDDIFDTSVNPNYYESIDGIARNNVIINTPGAGISAWAASGAKIYNNTLINVAETMQAGIFVYGQDELIGYVPSNNVTVTNNIIVMSAASSRPAVGIKENSLRGWFHTNNNLYFQAGKSASFWDESNTSNKFYGNLSAWKTRFIDSGSMENDPRLDASKNYCPLPGSPAINAGAVLPEVGADYVNIPRPQGAAYDIGAYEMTGSSTTTPAPTVSISAFPTTVSAGGSSTLSWSSTNASSCIAGGAWTGSKTMSGTQSTGALNSLAVYTLTCTGAGGNATAAAVINVGAVPTSTNLALRRPAFASSTENSANIPTLTTDGNSGTRWASVLYQDPQWIYVDLGQTYSINRVIVRWEAAYAADYQIQVSNDASNWTTIRSITSGTGGTNDLTGLSGSGRYVRIYGTRRGSSWGYSIWEFEVYGTTAASLSPASMTAAALSPTTLGAFSLWSASDTPRVISEPDASPVEIGMKFQSDARGVITGLRFYKSRANIGTHVGHIWGNTGQLLGSITFSNESSQGWQEAKFPVPISIQPNTTYVASYFAPAGRYSVDLAYFAAKGRDSGPLHALKSGAAGPNGVYKYSAGSAYPTSSYRDSNYWVDVIFQKTP